VLAQDGGALLPARATDTGRPVLERVKEGETGATDPRRAMQPTLCRLFHLYDKKTAGVPLIFVAVIRAVRMEFFIRPSRLSAC